MNMKLFYKGVVLILVTSTLMLLYIRPDNQTYERIINVLGNNNPFSIINHTYSNKFNLKTINTYKLPSPIRPQWLKELDEAKLQKKKASEEKEALEEFSETTPKDFVEIKQIRPKKKTSVVDLHRKKTKWRGQNNAKKNDHIFKPQFLQRRAANYSSLRKFMKDMDYRSNWIKGTCHNLTTRSPDALTGADRHTSMQGPPKLLSGYHSLLIDRSNYIAYCPIYKAASTSWSITMLELKGLWKKQGNKRLQQVLQSSFPAISNIAVPSVAREATAFMVVRHPLERLLSCYRDKFENGRKDYYYIRYGERMVKTYRELPKRISQDEGALLLRIVRKKIEAGASINLPDNIYANPPGPTFEEFVKWITSVRQDDEHWRPYFIHCSPCHINYNMILRFENLADEGELFLEYLNRSNQVETRWANSHNKDTASTKEVACAYYNKISVELLKKIIKKYEIDFAMFQYSPNEYIKCAQDYYETSTTELTR